MILCDLDRIIAENKTSILKVSSDTKISRTTLTALSSNTFQGIQLDTINTLCKYFGIGIERLLLFTKYDYDIVAAPQLTYEGIKDGGLLTVEINVSYSGIIKNCELDIDVRKRQEGDIVKIEAEVFFPTEFTEEDLEWMGEDYKRIYAPIPELNRFLAKSLNEIDTYFKSHIRKQIENVLHNAIKTTYKIEEYELFIDYIDELY